MNSTLATKYDVLLWNNIVRDAISKMPILMEKCPKKITHCVLVVPMQPTIGQRVRAVKTLAPNELDWD